MSRRPILLTVLALALALVPTWAAADPLAEAFDDPMDLGHSWLSEVSNITNYYGTPNERGNNPTGLWISMKNPLPTEVHITFEPQFGDTVATLSLDASCWVSGPDPTVFFVLDMEGNEVYSALCKTNESTPVLEYPHHFEARSDNGILAWGFRGTAPYGNTAVDNITVTFREDGEAGLDGTAVRLPE